MFLCASLMVVSSLSVTLLLLGVLNDGTNMKSGVTAGHPRTVMLVRSDGGSRNILDVDLRGAAEALTLDGMLFNAELYMLATSRYCSLLAVRRDL